MDSGKGKKQVCDCMNNKCSYKLENHDQFMPSQQFCFSGVTCWTVAGSVSDPCEI